MMSIGMLSFYNSSQKCIFARAGPKDAQLKNLSASILKLPLLEDVTTAIRMEPNWPWSFENTKIQS